LHFAGPLVAVVNAQAQAALSSANFVNAVGFDDEKRAISVDFLYEATNATTGESQMNKISVPLLAMLPIPFLRVRELKIDVDHP
jgi:hypothetical protein